MTFYFGVVSRIPASLLRNGLDGSANSSITAQSVMPLSMGAAWTPKFDGEKAKFVEWGGPRWKPPYGC